LVHLNKINKIKKLLWEFRLELINIANKMSEKERTKPSINHALAYIDP